MKTTSPKFAISDGNLAFEHTIAFVAMRYESNPYVRIGRDFNVFSEALDSMNANKRIIRCIGIFSQKTLESFMQSLANRQNMLNTLQCLHAKKVALELFLCDCESFLSPALLGLQVYCQLFCFKGGNTTTTI